MSAKKTASAAIAEPPAVKVKPPRRSVVASAIVIVCAIVLAFVMWPRVRAHVLGGENYLVDPSKVVVSPLPEWIRTDFRDEIMREAGQAGPVSLMDPDLTTRIANLASTHPWVERVARVSKRYPSSIEVVLTYRQPVAMVEVPDGALPIDVHGVMLPHTDFTPEDAVRYPLIGSINSAYPQYAGLVWEDRAVLGAAQLAAILSSEWAMLGLGRIDPASTVPAALGGSEYIYVLTTRGGSKIEWGRTPASDLPSDLSAGKKVAAIKKYISEHGSLDLPGNPRQFNFSDTGELIERAPLNIKARPRRT